MGISYTKESIDQAVNRQRKAQQEKHSSQILKVTDYKSRCQKPQKEAPERVGYVDFDSRPIQEKSPVQEKVLKKIIPDQDGRIRVNATREWPHSVHGMLSMKFGHTLYTGTATMIGPNIAITAAHNLYDFDTKIEVKVSDVHFHPGANDQLLPFGVVEVLAFYYPEEYKTTKKEDYALLILKKNIGHQTGYFGLHAIESQDLEDKKINITGYPGDKVADKPKCHQMWGMEGPICHFNDDLISYQIDTFHGQSGSGIWYDAGDEYYIVGVHVHSYGFYNQGIFLNKKRLERIREWILSFYLKPENSQLQSLDLYWKHIGEKGAEYLSKANFPLLQSLYLGWNQIGEKGAEYLSNANFPLLQSLHLSLNQIGDKGVEYLSKANFPHLQSLNLCSNQIGDKGAEYLSKANFPHLQSLNLGENQIGDKGAEYLRQANFPHLQSLDLGRNQIGDKGAEYLSKSNFPLLQLLFLFGNQIGDKGAEYLSKASFPQLQSLNLSSNQIGDKGVEYLSKAIFPQLQSLYLSSNKIGEKGAEYLSKAKFPLLQSLGLCNNNIGTKAAEHLSKANFPHLQSLELSENQIEDEGVEYLSKANFPHLRVLDLNKNQIGEKGAEYLKKINFKNSLYLNNKRHRVFET